LDNPNFYRIRVRGHLDDTFAEWFEGMTITNEEGGVALLSGYLPDQAALHGVLDRINNLGLTLISVTLGSEKE
jgi:hypothetical protein